MWDGVSIETKPTSLPVTLEATKEHLDVDYPDDDTIIDGLIKAAISQFDGPTGIGIALCTQTWKLSLERFPYGEIKLPGWPVKSVTSVEYVDGEGADQTLAVANYDVFLGGDNPRICPAYGKSWPTIRLVGEAVKVTYVVGEAVDSVDELLKVAIKQTVSHWYENREAVSEFKMHTLPMAAQMIMNDFRRGSVA